MDGDAEGELKAGIDGRVRGTRRETWRIVITSKTSTSSKRHRSAMGKGRVASRSRICRKK